MLAHRPHTPPTLHLPTLYLSPHSLPHAPRTAVACPANTAGTDVVEGCLSGAGYYGVVIATLEDPFYATDGVNGAPQSICDDDPGKCGCVGQQVTGTETLMKSGPNNAHQPATYPLSVSI